MTVLVNQKELERMNHKEVKNRILVLKSPKFWNIKTKQANSRANFFEGDVQWGFLYSNECKICNFENPCNSECKHHKFCKLYVIRNDEGNEIVRVKRMNVNARLAVRSTEGAAGYDLSAAHTAVVPARGKCLVKTGLAMAIPNGCYGRVAPRSGLALKKFIDVGAGVIDSDYRGELGVILFNFSDEDFVINMGDRIAQLIFEKIKTPKLKELDSLEGTGRGKEGYGSTGVSAAKLNDELNREGMKTITSCKKQIKVEDRNNAVSQSKWLVSAREMRKLAKGDNPAFLAIVRATNEVSPNKKSNK